MDQAARMKDAMGRIRGLVKIQMLRRVRDFDAVFIEGRVYTFEAERAALWVKKGKAVYVGQSVRRRATIGGGKETATEASPTEAATAGDD